MNTLNYENTETGQLVTTPNGDPVAIIRVRFGRSDRNITGEFNGRRWEIYMRRSDSDIQRRCKGREMDPHALTFNQAYWWPLRENMAPHMDGRFHSLEAAQYQILANYIEAQEAVASRRAS